MLRNPLTSRLIGLILGLLVLPGCAQSAIRKEPTVVAADLNVLVQTYRQRQDDARPAAVLAWLQAGNRRFVAGKSNHGGLPTDARQRVRVASNGQRPLAVVLSCIDSRTAPELVFDTSIGDLFTVRVGGNVVNDDILGSLEVAVESGAKLIVVLGHTDCGAIKGACGDLKMGRLTQLLERVKPSIAVIKEKLSADPALAQRLGEPVPSNRRYIAEVSHANAQLSAEQIRTRSPLLREHLDRGDILLLSAIIDVDSGKVSFDQ